MTPSRILVLCYAVLSCASLSHALRGRPAPRRAGGTRSPGERTVQWETPALGSGPIAQNAVVSNLTALQMSLLTYAPDSIQAQEFFIHLAALVPVDPSVYLVNGDWDQPNVTAILSALDFLNNATMNTAPIEFVIRLEYNTSYWYPRIGFGTRAQWENIGLSFGNLLSFPATQMGVWTTFVLFSAADLDPGFTQRDGLPGTAAYLDAVTGFAAGVRIAAPVRCGSLCVQVYPGSFASHLQAPHNYTLGGLGPLLAPLWQNGTLDAIDLAMVYDEVNWPLTPEHSAQVTFDRVRAACGVTGANVGFATTQLNVLPAPKLSEEAAAAQLYTALWDAFNVMNSQSEAVSVAIIVDNMFELNTSSAFGLTASWDPYVPTPRGQAFNFVGDVPNAFYPWHNISGMFVSGAGWVGMLPETIVWHNRAGWSNVTGPSIELPTPCDNGGDLSYFSWRGLNTTIPVGNGVVSLNVFENETALFVIGCE